MSPPTAAVAPDASILVVDDEPANIALLRRILGGAGYVNVAATTDPREALGMFEHVKPDLVVLDLHMPVVDGFAVLNAIERIFPGERFLPVLVLTADITDGAKHRALSSGAADFVTKPFDVTEVLLRIRNLLQTRQFHLDIERENLVLAVQAGEQARQLDDARLETAHRLTIAAELRDDETGHHIERVGTMAARLARVMNLDEQQIVAIGTAARLHDIGKIGVPDAVLMKSGVLSNEEFEVMRAHTIIGSGILSGSASPVLQMAAEVARTHHERWDGGGYPQGLAGTAIPLAGRITAVADAFDAMTNARRYRAAREVGNALEEIRRSAGSQFDPGVVTALLSLHETQAPASSISVA